jgi:hypothetical protein
LRERFKLIYTSILTAKMVEQYEKLEDIGKGKRAFTLNLNRQFWSCKQNKAESGRQAPCVEGA